MYCVVGSARPVRQSLALGVALAAELQTSGTPPVDINAMSITRAQTDLSEPAPIHLSSPVKSAQRCNECRLSLVLYFSNGSSSAVDHGRLTGGTI